MDERTIYPYYEDLNLGLLRLWGKRRSLDVLDVGCGFARNGWAIQKLGNRVVGIENDADAASLAEQRLERVVRVDLLDLDAVRAELGNVEFDVIIFADVLEHLAWPVGTLRSYLQFLREGGSVIVSVPNVALWSVRLGLLFGSFRYSGSGVLDATHLRFFTRRTTGELLDDAGLEPIATTYNPGIVRAFLPIIKRVMLEEGDSAGTATLIESRSYQLYSRFVYPIERVVAAIAPGLLSIQIVTEARPR